MEDSADLDAEILGAGAAVEALGLIAGAVVDIEGIAERALGAIGPALLDEPILGGLIIGEFLDDFDQGDALAKRLARTAKNAHNPALLCMVSERILQPFGYICPGKIVSKGDWSAY